MKFYDFLIDPLLGALGDPTYRAWHLLARILDGDARFLSADDLAFAHAVTGRTAFPDAPVREFYAALGRRSGKTLFGSRLAVYHLAQDYRARLQSGETAVVACVATDRRQAALLFNYARACVTDSPLLRELLVRETSDTLEFSHRTALEIHTGSLRATRGRTFAAVLLDEAAFLRSDESANPDIEVVRAVRPGLATLRGMLIVLSSPYMRRGVLFDAHRKHYGHNDAPALYVMGDTRLFNPTIPADIIEADMADDPEAAASEWGGQFRSDLSAAFDPAWIDAVTDEITERPPEFMLPEGRRPTYKAFTDPAGGGGRDSWATAIVHFEQGVGVQDALLEIRPPFNTGDAAGRVATFLKRYGLHSVMGDRYAGQWPADALREHGIGYEPSELSKSEIYLECVGLFSAGRIRLLNNSRLLTQLRMLERRTRAGGKDSIDHPPGANDDVANAVCGALLRVARIGKRTEDARTVAVQSPVARRAPLELAGMNVAPENEFVSIFEGWRDQPAILRGLF